MLRQPLQFKIKRLEEKLCLIETGGKNLNPVFVDFVEGPMRHRLKAAGLRSELLSRAMGAKKGLHILDATVGFGGDAFVLAHLGYRVTAIEKNPVVFELLEDGVRRALDNEGTREAAQRLEILNFDFFEFSKSSKPEFDCIYLDPMFPQKTKSSLPRKEMQILQALLEEDDYNIETEALYLFNAAMSLRTDKIVVKRPAYSKPIDKSEHIKFEGKTVRFDVYKPCLRTD